MAAERRRDLLSADLVYRSPGQVSRIKKSELNTLTDFIEGMLHSPSLQRNIFDTNVIDLSSTYFEEILFMIQDCARELLVKILFDELGGVVSRDLLYTITLVCLSLSIKLIGAYDWINDANIYKALLSKAIAKKKHIEGNKFSLMETDIMARTGWKGCSLAAIERGPFQQPIFDLKIVRGIWYLKDTGGKTFTTETFIPLGIKEAIVQISPNLIRFVEKGRELSTRQAINWIVERVLQYGFEIENVQVTLK